MKMTTMTTMKTMMMKARARAAMRAIRLARSAIDAFPPAPDETRPGRNVVGAIELERNASVEELEPALGSVVVVRLPRCPPREKAFPGCAGLAPGQTVWAEWVAPTTRIAPVTAVGGLQTVCHVRPLQVAQNGSAYPDCNPDCKPMLAGRESSRMADYPAGWRPRANRDFAR